jgi:DNA invertase Pin-like site-specific DNA recombinase
MQVVICARVSSPTQNIANQREILLDHCRIRGFQVDRIFEDTATGSNTARPGFQELIKYLHRGGYAEAVVVYKLDRLGRSLRNLLAIVDDLNQRNIGFISVLDNIDTTTAHGRLFFHLMASLSEYERDLIRDRCSAGKTHAIANGVKFGRPRKHIDIDRVNEMLLAGIPKTKIAKKLNVSYRCLTQRLKIHRHLPVG